MKIALLVLRITAEKRIVTSKPIF